MKEMSSFYSIRLDSKMPEIKSNNMHTSDSSRSNAALSRVGDDGVSVNKDPFSLQIYNSIAIYRHSRILYDNMNNKKNIALKCIFAATQAIEVLDNQDLQDPQIEAAVKQLVEVQSKHKVIPAREMWAARDLARKENPATFIKRVFSEEVARKSLTLTALRRADLTLYKAYMSHIRKGRHPEDDLGLKSEIYTSETNAIDENSVSRKDFTITAPVATWIPVSSLSLEERDARRVFERNRKREQRARKSVVR